MAAMNQKLKEVGWFYHAPAKKGSHEAVGAPPPSQIPGLGETETLEPEEPREMVFRDTDTKYIRMAKMGGRKDLLTIKPNEMKKNAVSYPRNDWFYLADNEMEDRANKEQEEVDWQFMLPEYMVHQSRGAGPSQGGDLEGGVPMRRAPYATETQSQFSRDGFSMTDKTVKIPEVRPPGYGVRSGKPPPRGPVAKLEKAKPQSSQIQGERPRLKHQPLPHDTEEATNMNKLLANTYEREWHERVDKWQDKQQQHQEKSQTFTGNDRPVCSEYGNNYATSSQKSQRRVGSGNSKASAQKKREEPKKEPFKMSKFKNVPARISSHQSPEILAAVGN
ncbi:hypothetical protein ACOMHN_005103 [Nucella lapillus]